jgi:hypothetical protein
MYTLKNQSSDYEKHHTNTGMQIPQSPGKEAMTGAFD